MNRLLFLVDKAPEGGYTARELNYSIFTEAADIKQLELNITEAIECHFQSIDNNYTVELQYFA
jgi:hypothetical protein